MPIPHRTQMQLMSGVLVQIVEIPGLISGAAEGRGGGRALLGVLRSADADADQRTLFIDAASAPACSDSTVELGRP